LDDSEHRWDMLMRHRDVALGVVLRATGSLAEAEDCVHDAMLRLARRSDLDPARVRSLLIRTALHIAIDHRRAAAREQAALVRLGGGAGGEAVSPEQTVAQRADVARVLAAVDSLPRRERQVMFLRLMGLDVAETAARLGISPKSVEGAFTRARARLRLLFGGLLGWLAGRLRRIASPHREVAATTAAALLLTGPPWGTGGDEPPQRSPARAPAAIPRTGAGTGGMPPARADLHRGGGDPKPPPPRHHPPKSDSRWGKHDPHPGAWAVGPFDTPYDLASWGVDATVMPIDPTRVAQAVEDCLAHAPISTSSGPC
jgi:RNA polymerase sigma-70 factor (ECF subfamily)